MHTVATVIEGEVDLADISFLLALILFVLAVIMVFVDRAPAWLRAVLVPAGLAFLALGFLAL